MRHLFLLLLIANLPLALAAQRGTGKAQPASTKTQTPTTTRQQNAKPNTQAQTRSNTADNQTARRNNGTSTNARSVNNPPAQPSTLTQTQTRTPETSTRPSTQPTVTPGQKIQPGKTGAATLAPAATTGTQTTPGTAPKTTPTSTEAAKPVGVQWMTIEEALEKCKTEKRKIYLDVYTDWCGWCKRMDQTTFADPRVARYLNDNYYPVKFNAEQQQDIVFRGKTYKFEKVGNRGYHQLAAELLNGKLSYPTSVFLDEDLNVIQSLSTYLEAQKFETILNYFGTNNHKKTPWETYERTFVNNRNR